jgi:predicted nucleic acid-binding protein
MAAMFGIMVYIETSMFNMFFDENEKNQDKREWTRRFFAAIKQGVYKPFTSRYVVNELEDTPDEEREKREAMLAMIDEYNIEILPTNAEAERLAWLYIRNKAFTEKRLADAFHVAMATIHGLPFIVSYNFQHISRPFTRRHVKPVNLREGYQHVSIITPRGIERCRQMKKRR